MSLSKTLYPLLITGSTKEGPSQLDLKNVDRDNKNQIKQTHDDLLNHKYEPRSNDECFVKECG